MRFTLLPVLLSILVPAPSFTGFVTNYKKLKRTIETRQGSVIYGASAFGFAILYSLYHMLQKNSITKKNSGSPYFYRPNTVVQQKTQLNTSFLILNPETMKLRSTCNEKFDFYRAKKNHRINRINLIYTKDLCSRIRTILDKDDPNKYMGHNILLSQTPIPEDDSCLCDADLLCAATIFTLASKDSLQHNK